jgi:hypothetical protein
VVEYSPNHPKAKGLILATTTHNRRYKNGEKSKSNKKSTKVIRKCHKTISFNKENWQAGLAQW